VEESHLACFDALTGEYFPHRRLFTPTVVEDAEYHPIPVYLGKPSLDTLDLMALRRLWLETRRAQTKEAQAKDLIEITGIDKSFLGYRPMRILQFVRPEDRELLVHVYDGAERSLRHEIALMHMEKNRIHALRVERKPKAAPVSIEDPIKEIVEPEVYEAALRRHKELPKLDKAIEERKSRIDEERQRQERSTVLEDKQQAEKQIADLQSEIEQLINRVAELDSATQSTEVLSMAEHRPKLFQALAEAKKQIIITSPWITPTAVNQEMREAIAASLARDVQVWIGYGFGDADRREQLALDRFKDLQKGKGGKNLVLKRLNVSHAKVVVCDDRYMITTSFNWLSFAGREDWGNRVEFGTLSRNPKAVQAMLERLMSLFESAPAT
jgi:hypothetical protein